MINYLISRFIKMIMKFLKSLIKNIIPSTISYSGPFKNWKSLNNSNSYDKSNLQEYLFKQAKQVWENKEVYERDGHIFKTIHRSWHVSLSILEISKSLNKSNIKVCDFGGGYGTSYIENKFLINKFSIEFDWNIIELKELVQNAKQIVPENKIKFFDDIDKHLYEADILLFGSSLQYLENPYSTLDKCINKIKPKYIIFDRTGFSSNKNDEIFLQNVNLRYKASYPAWIFSENKFLEHLNKMEYIKIDSWRSNQIPKSKQTFMGYLFKASL